jgi:alpha-amylase
MFQRVLARRWRAFGAAVVVAAAALTLSVVLPNSAPSAAAAPPGERDVIAQMFQWNWNSVGAECQRTLGPSGYGAVQVSPPGEHVVLPGSGYPWWQDYQPVSYKVDQSRRGTRAEFQAMVQACHSAGVKVYVDTVINHMTGQENCGTGSAGSSYCHYETPAVPYGSNDFHHCGRNGNDDIANWRDRFEVQNCELVNLSDLATESDYVRGKIAGYFNDLLSLGVDGFRVDAAKHMPAGDIGAIVSRLSRPAYVYQEVLHGEGEDVQPEEYLGNGDVYDLRYGKDIAKIFNNEKLAYLKTFGSPLPSNQAVVFVDNHDSQRSGSTLSFKSPAQYTLASAFMLAWTYGTPKTTSSYEFSSSDQGPPSDGSGKTNNATCFSGGWVCEHDWQAIRNMVGFRNTVRGEAVVNWTDNGNDLIAFGRGTKGFLVLNGEPNAVGGGTYQSQLPAGTYCDIMRGDVAGGSCTGPTITVDSSGKFTADLGPTEGLALHIGAKIG